MTQTGYKRCGNFIVVLEILGENNESHKDVIDRNHAKFQCSKAKVLDILNLDGTSSDKNEVEDYDICYLQHTYIKNEIIEGWDKIYVTDDVTGDVTEYCEPEYDGHDVDYDKYFSIPYQLTIEAAQNGKFIPKNYTGILKTFYDDGRLCYFYTYKDGKKDGLHMTWHHFGILGSKYIYKNDKIERAVVYDPFGGPSTFYNHNAKFRWLSERWSEFLEYFQKKSMRKNYLKNKNI